MARQILDKRERELELETDRIARESAHRERLNAEAADLGRRFEHSIGRLENLGAERKSLMITSGEEDPNDDSIAELAQLRRAVAAARTATDAAESLRSETHTAEISAREVLQKAEGELARSRAEADALRDLLSVNEDDLWPPLIDSISVDAGFEAALGAALGDDLVVSSDDGAPAHWRGLPPFQSPPSLPTSHG